MILFEFLHRVKFKYVIKTYLGEILFEIYKDKKGKYWRWLWEIFIDWINLNEELIKRGYAKEFMKK